MFDSISSYLCKGGMFQVMYASIHKKKFIPYSSSNNNINLQREMTFKGEGEEFQNLIILAHILEHIPYLSLSLSLSHTIIIQALDMSLSLCT